MNAQGNLEKALWEIRANKKKTQNGFYPYKYKDTEEKRNRV